MKTKSLPLLFPAVLVIALAAFARADEGMWLINRPPLEQLEKKYGFVPDAAWLDHVQKSCVRISTGGSGSIVSPNGLVMTNHHVGSDLLEKLSTKENDLLERGFLARTLEEEVSCPEVEMHVLWEIEDVTARVQGAAKPEMSSAEANTARRGEMSTIEKESSEKTGLKSEIVTLWQGGRYHLYRYKRYTDVRLVFAPEKKIAFFGGDTDNFEYPRFNLDVTFFRIYQDGKPLKPEHWLRWSRQGASDGSLVFVAGHPGSTERGLTVAHTEFMRDVRYPMTLRNLWRREVQLETFSQKSAEHRRIAEGDLFGVKNSRKAITGRLSGLLDPAIFGAKSAAEKALRDAVAKNPEHQTKWGGAWDQIAAAQTKYREFYPRYVALGGASLGLGGNLFGIAKDLVRLAEERPKPSADRLREYRDSNLDSVELGLYSPAPIYPELEVSSLESSLQWMCELLGAGDPTVAAALGGKSPRARAEELVAGTKLGDVEERKRIAAGGKAAIESSKDPLIALVKALDPESRKLRKRYEDEIESAQREGYAKIAAADFAVRGENQYPDATFTLRLSYGTVKGWQEGGRTIAPFTNFAGLYERAAERKGERDFELPARWANQRDSINPNTPFNFVSTNDIIGGNSGSPVFDKKGEVVGLIFDGNIDSLVLNNAYSDERARAVSVDARAIVESLRRVYDAQALADELAGPTGG